VKKHTRGAIVLAAAVTVGGVTAGVAVHAAQDAPWQAATIKSPNAVGALSLVDAAGAPVTSGRTDEPLAAWAVGSGALTSGDTAAHTSATLSIYTPTSVVSAPVVPSQPNAVTTGPDSWTGTQVSAPTTQDTVPAAISGGPAAKLAGSVTLAQYIAAYPNQLTDTAYAGVYELRLSTGATGRGVSPSYAVLDIAVNGDTWHLYGEGGTSATATTTTLAATPSGAKAGQAVVLTATVSPTAEGTVQFKAGSTNVGAPATVDGSGHATTTWTPTAAGTVQLAAAFTPADSGAYAASSSAATSYTVASSTATPTVTATWPTFRWGTAASVRVSVASTPAASGTVGIVYAGKVIASAPVSGGVATVKLPATALPAGTRSLVARFTSAAPATVASRDSAARSVVVAKAVAKVAATTVPKKVKKSKKTSFVFTVTAPGGAATGTVKVYDGAKVVATVTLKGGRATVALKLKKGKHTLKAAYLGNANVAAATGAAVTVTSK
jgi:hypothetical protein